MATVDEIMSIPDFCQIPLVTPRLRVTLVASFVGEICIVGEKVSPQRHTERWRSQLSGSSKETGACLTDARDA
jgi:hypothetical protein